MKLNKIKILQTLLLQVENKFKMKKLFIKFLNWLDKREPRERWMFFGIGFVLIYCINNLFILSPIKRKENRMVAEISGLEEQETKIQEQIETARETLEDQKLIELATKHKSLNEQMKALTKRLMGQKPKVYTAEELEKLTKDILRQPDNNFTLVSFKELPVQEWPPKQISNKNVLHDITGGKIYQHGIEIEIYSDYFSTINFVKKIEELPQHIYWDSLEYKVTDYPKAKVKIIYHVLSTQKT